MIISKRIKFYLSNRFKNINLIVIKFIFLKMEVLALENQAKNIIMEKLLKLIEKYPDKPWEWGYAGISNNPNLTIEIIEKYPSKPWDWTEISSSQNITMEILEKYPDKDWDFQAISYNPNLTIDFLNIVYGRIQN